MRLQRRLYGIFLARFLAFRVPCRQNWLLYVPLSKPSNTLLNVETKIQALNRHIFRVLSRLYSLIILYIIHLSLIYHLFNIYLPFTYQS